MLNILEHRIEVLRTVAILLLILITHIVGCAQDLYYEQFTEVDGLPSLMTYEMVQDSNDILWIGTENGLVSFDGDNFQRYSHPDLIDNDIIEIALDKNGRIYFLNLSGQFAFVEKETVELINTDSFESKMVNVITTENGDFVVVNKYINNKRSTFINEYFQTSDGQFHFEKTDKNSFLIWDNHHYSYVYDSEKSTFSSDSLKTFKFIKTQGRIYEISSGECIYVNKNRIFFETECLFGELSEQGVIKNITTNKNKSFAKLDKGVLIFDSKSQKSYEILNDIQFNTFFVDKESNVWCSTTKEGLIKIPYIDMQLESKKIDFIEDYGVNDIINDDYGNIYIGTTTGQVLIFSKNKKLLKNVTVSSNSKPISFYKNEDEIYGILELSLFKINQKTRDIKTQKNGLFGPKSLLFENDSIIVGSRSGIYNVTFNEFANIPVNQKSGLSSNWVNSMYKNDLQDEIYFGTTTGLYKREKSKEIVRVNLESLMKSSISDITAGSDNSIWIGTRNLGAFRILGDSIVEHFDTSNGLVSNNINRLKVLNNQLLVSTVDGVSIKNLKTNEVNNITALSGLDSKEIFVCTMVDGEYWVGSNAGLSIIKPNQLSSFKDNGPKLSVKDFYANGVNVVYEDNIQFPYGINTILINFRNISLQRRKNKSIKYRINSKDSAWVYSTDPLIRLQSLKYGTYKIEAIGLNSNKVEGNKVELAFTINPPWWQTWWARIIGLLILISLIQFVYGVRAKRIRKEEETKRDYLTQINAIKDQALQLQMNPHFIFNSLNAIQGFIGTDEEEMAMNYLARFARLIRLIFEHSKGNSISLEEELEFINLYVNLEKLRFKEKVNVDIGIDPEVEHIKDIIHVPPLLIQPIIENSFKHGLFHKKEKGNLSIKFSLQNEILQVIIEDDGIGRVAAQKISQHNSEKHTSSGIKTTLERIELLNFGKDEKLNRVEIDDLYEDSNATGTRTTLYLSIR